MARAARERSEQERETQPLTARRSPLPRTPEADKASDLRKCRAAMFQVPLALHTQSARAKACHDAPPTNLGCSRHETYEHSLAGGCGCRKLCRGWSGGISVLVDESTTAGRSNDLEVSVWLVCSVGGDGWSLVE